MPIIGSSASSIKPVPVAPTIGTATNVGTGRAYNNGAATVTFTAPNSKLPITSYTVTSSPGGYTGTGASSPITVTGLQSATAYTFSVTATSSVGTSNASSASSSITATTVPQAPTIGSATAGNGSSTVTYTAGATGGATVTTYTATSSGGQTGTGASPITVSGSNGTAYTFTVRATNANGQSAASSASNSVTPFVPYTPRALGSIGPGGGRIVYDAGSNLSWGRYIEAMPNVGGANSWPAAFTAVYVDAPYDAQSYSSSTAIGTGYTNTQNAYNLGYGRYSVLVAQAWDLTLGGKTDWFIPSQDDLYQVVTQFYPTYIYAAIHTSSSQYSATNLWYWYGNWSGSGSGHDILKSQNLLAVLARYVNQSEG